MMFKKIQFDSIGLFVIILATAAVILSIVAGLFIYQGQKKAVTTDKSTLQLQKQSSSDEVSAIEKDLNMTDLDGLDSELQSIEDELESAY